MPHVVCPRCQRANPHEAVFCHFDGVELRPSAGFAAFNQLPQEFTFPSGRRCRTYDDLVQGCQYEWDDARDLLRQGKFGHFLASIGRMDLVRAAQEVQAKANDPDIALHDFINRLPAHQVAGPRLDLHPRRLILGTLKAGESCQVQLTVTNLGKGLLHGSIKVTEGGEWLHLPAEGSAGGNGQCTLKTAREQQVTLRIVTTGLPAPQSYSARLAVITNGGIVDVPVRLDLTPQPFLKAPFQGATNPRALAERMRTNPQRAVPLLEGGEVKKWFGANGWTYPVAGKTAKGVAAVQQFFEGMGLSRPPPVQMADTAVHLVCQPGETAPGQIKLRTTAKKWVYAQADSDAVWLRVTTPNVSGPQEADIAFEADASLMDAGRLYEGNVLILANAGQKLSLRVRAEVRRPQVSLSQLVFRPVLVGALLGLVYRLFLAGPADLYARVLAATPNPTVPPGSLFAWTLSPLDEPGFIRHFVLLTWWLGALLGGLLLWRRGDRWTDVFCGVIAGAGAGVAGSATFACLLPVINVIPRLIWSVPYGLFKETSLADSAWLWTPVWIVLCAACWAAIGGVLGLLLRSAGRWGLSVLGCLTWPLSTLLEAVGWKRAAAVFVLE
jgi:hypothetical protein